MVELLAPAGQIESGYAAFNYGADAVYLGLTHFSARAEAQNFTPELFNGFVRYAHELHKKVLVAVNTVFFEDEKATLIDTLQVIESAKADGVIVQDLGTARLIKKYFPSLRLHASTQMAVHNRDGVEALRDMGFKRVVLARELTLDEITDICRVPDIEKEVFIHGALCYCYSGLCLFSSIYAKRSANRGKCVYPCREVFRIDGQSKHIFSMKDLAQNENVRLLEQVGVTALKIEGRKKSPLYVGAVTDYYRSILDGEKNTKVLENKKNNISCIFSRPTTDLYLKKRKNFNVVDPDIVGHRGLLIGSVESFSVYGKEKYIRFKTNADIGRYDGIQIDLPEVEKPFGFSAQALRVKGKNVFEVKAGNSVEIVLPSAVPFIPVGAKVYLSSCGMVKKAYPFVKPKENTPLIAAVRVKVVVDEHQITACAEGQSVSVAGDFPVAQSFESVQKAIHEAFLKTGGTGLVLEKIKIENPKKLFVPVSVLNDLRRKLYELIAKNAQQNEKNKKEEQKENILKRETLPFVDVKTSVSYSIKTDDPDFAAALENEEKINEIVFELSEETQTDFFSSFAKDKIRFALPCVARAWEIQKLKDKAESLISAGFKKFEIANVWGIAFLKNKNVSFSVDWPMYVANSCAARAVLELKADYFVVSPETPDPQGLFSAFPDQAAGLIYQDMPLFVSETCPYAAINGKCQNCGGNRQEKMTSRYGTFLSVMKNCRHFLLAEKPVLKKREMIRSGAKILRAEFLRRADDVAEKMKILRRLIQN